MRIVFIFFSLLFFVQVLKSQKQIEVPLIKDPNANAYHLMASLNGEEYDFLFDTGATGLLINKAVFDDLTRKGKLSQADFIGTSQATIANGSTININVVNIKTLEIGGQVLKNLRAGVVNNNSAALLFGQDALSKFGSVTIDYNQQKLILTTNPAGGTAQVSLKSLKEIKLIPCSINDQNTLDDLKSILAAAPELRNVTLLEEANIPPGRAVNRITEGTVTIRYFSQKDQSVANSAALAKLLDEFITLHDAGFRPSALVRENMLSAFNNQSLPDYIEIWVRQR
jgi:aspartyl protease family protein